MGQKPMPGAASRIASAGRARSSCRFVAPSLRANSRPFASRLGEVGDAARGRGNSAPLSPIARANSPLASGEARSALTAIEPADSPAIVTARAIAAEDGDVALDPLQRGDEIEQAVVAGGADFGFLREFGMREKAERVEAMVERDDDDALRGEAAAVVARLRSRADDEAAAVDPDHHRQRRVAGCAGVQTLR